MSAEDYRWLYSSGAERFKQGSSYDMQQRKRTIDEVSKYSDWPSATERYAAYRAMPRTTLNRGPDRVGYSSVPRTRGAAVTGEMKYFDTSGAGSLVGVTTDWAGTEVDPAQLCLFVPQQGAGVNQRIGKSVKLLKLKIRGFISVPVQAAQSGADSSAVIRLIIVQDMQTNSVQMAAEELMSDDSSANRTISTFQNTNGFGRFRVLKDRTFDVSNLNLAGSPTSGDVIQAGKVLHFKYTFNFKKPIVVRFNATNGGTVADIIDNSFHVICGASSIAYAPVLQYTSRCCYKE